MRHYLTPEQIAEAVAEGIRRERQETSEAMVNEVLFWGLIAIGIIAAFFLCMAIPLLFYCGLPIVGMGILAWRFRKNDQTRNDIGG